MFLVCSSHSADCRVSCFEVRTPDSNGFVCDLLENFVLLNLVNRFQRIFMVKIKRNKVLPLRWSVLWSPCVACDAVWINYCQLRYLTCSKNNQLKVDREGVRMAAFKYVSNGETRRKVCSCLHSFLCLREELYNMRKMWKIIRYLRRCWCWTLMREISRICIVILLE